MEAVRKRKMWTSALAAVIFLFAVTTRSGAQELPAISAAAAEYHGGSIDTGQLYTQCLLSTIRHDVTFENDQTTYVITGDIGAMWLRDASAQVRPYLYFADDVDVRNMLRGVITREAKDLLLDPYANAFNREYKVAEEKYELDSLLYPIQLAWTYWKKTRDTSVFTRETKAAYEKALGLIELERDHSFSTYRHSELTNNGAGAPVAVTGMVWTAFRPSDDAATYGYNIPDEMFAAVVLGELEDIEQNVWRDGMKHDEIDAVRRGIVDGIDRYGIVYTPRYGYIYAYEVDGLGHSMLMDDANVPSLLSIPYMGYAPINAGIYANTRRFVLSPDNPYYFIGKFARGVGSPHTPHGYVWPLSLVMEGLTSSDGEEISQVLSQLQASDTGDHLLHESFDPNEPKNYTRPNFGWPCSLFSELVLDRVMGTAPLPVPRYTKN